VKPGELLDACRQEFEKRNFHVLEQGFRHATATNGQQGDWLSQCAAYQFRPQANGGVRVNVGRLVQHVQGTLAAYLAQAAAAQQRPDESLHYSIYAAALYSANGNAPADREEWIGRLQKENSTPAQTLAPAAIWRRLREWDSGRWQIGPLLDLAGEDRPRARECRVPILLRDLGLGDGRVAWLQLVVLTRGTGSCYPRPGIMDLHPCDDEFLDTFRKAWQQARRLAFAAGGMDAKDLDLCWEIEGVAARDAPPRPLAGASHGAVVAVALLLLLTNRFLPDDWQDWAVTAALGEGDRLAPVHGVESKVKEALAPGKPFRVMVVCPENQAEARAGATLAGKHPDLVIAVAETLPQILERIPQHGAWVTERLRAHGFEYRNKIELFLKDYLGTTDCPVPFAGRNEELDKLDRWLDAAGNDSYRLLLAPAGRGKSAMLARWALGLARRGDQRLLLVYLPVSSRHEINRFTVALPALAYHLREVLGLKDDGRHCQTADEWFGRIANLVGAFLREPGDRRLVVVIDGLDEANGWHLDTGLFPPNGNSQLRVLVAACRQLDDPKGEAWLQQRGWHPAAAIGLETLSWEGFQEVLWQMTGSLGYPGPNEALVDSLYRLTHGEPLLLKLYVQELWRPEEKEVGLKSEDLEGIRSGYEGFLRAWLRSRAPFWEKSRPHLEKVAYAVLQVLATKSVPLTLDDLLAALPRRARDRHELQECVLPVLRQFMLGDGRQQGYVLQHPGLSHCCREPLKEIIGSVEVNGAKSGFGLEVSRGNETRQVDKWMRGFSARTSLVVLGFTLAAIVAIGLTLGHLVYPGHPNSSTKQESPLPSNSETSNDSGVPGITKTPQFESDGGYGTGH
jgi:hypothetical protein